MKNNKKGNLWLGLFHCLIDQAKIMSSARTTIVDTVHELIGSLLKFLSAVVTSVSYVKASHSFSPKYYRRIEYIKGIELTLLSSLYSR